MNPDTRFASFLCHRNPTCRTWGRRSRKAQWLVQHPRGRMRLILDLPVTNCGPWPRFLTRSIFQAAI